MAALHYKIIKGFRYVNIFVLVCALISRLLLHLNFVILLYLYQKFTNKLKTKKPHT